MKLKVKPWVYGKRLTGPAEGFRERPNIPQTRTVHETRYV